MADLQAAYNDVMQVLSSAGTGLTLEQILERLTPQRRQNRYGEAEVRAIYWWLREHNRTTTRDEGTLVHA